MSGRNLFWRKMKMHFRKECVKLLEDHGLLYQQFFDNLQDTFESVPPSNVINYDKTNLSNNPGKKGHC